MNRMKWIKEIFMKELKKKILEKCFIDLFYGEICIFFK